MAEMKPITHADLKIGGKYLELGVALSGHMFLEYYEVLSESYWGTDHVSHAQWIDVQIAYPGRAKDKPYKTEESLSDMGCPKPPETCNSFHRTFHDTPKNRRELTQLVKDQNLHEYLSIIGENTEQAMEKVELNKQRSEEIRKTGLHEYI